MKKKYFESQEGQTLILIALMMVAIVGMLGLALDGGRVFAARRTSQNAADSAAFGATRLLATRSVTATEPMIWDTIVKFAKANGVITTTDIVAYFIDQSSKDICRLPNCGQVPAAATGVRVTTTLQMQPYFIDVLIGKQTIPVRAAAAAQSGPPVVATDLMPMSIKFPCTYDPTQPPGEQPCGGFHTGIPPYRLFGEKSVNGGFQWTSYDCQTDATDIAAFLRLVKPSGKVMADPSDTYYNPLNPTQYNTPPPDPNPWVCSGPGVEPNNNIQDALDCWLFPNGSKCWMLYSPPVKYPGDTNWTVPVFDHDNGLSGSYAKYHVVMFADFKFLGYWFANNQCNWLGRTTQDCGCTDDADTLKVYPKLACGDKQQPITSDLLECLVYQRKCLMGTFQTLVDPLEITPGQCNRNGLDICGIGMSQ